MIFYSLCQIHRNIDGIHTCFFKYQNIVILFQTNVNIKEISKYLSVFSLIRENANQNNSKYGHFLRSDSYRNMSEIGKSGKGITINLKSTASIEKRATTNAYRSHYFMIIWRHFHFCRKILIEDTFKDSNSYFRANA